MRLFFPFIRSVLLLAPLAGACAGQTESDLVRSSDAELGEMAAHLLPDLAARSGMELREPVRLERRTRAELVDYLTMKLDEELPADEARDQQEAFGLLGLVPPDLDLRALLMELYTEQVAGFYEPDSTALFVLDDQPPEALQALLVHELVHAVQDQTADLEALTDPELGNDRATAAQAAIEGHATLVMFEYLTEQMTGAPVDLGQIPDFGSQVRPALEAMSAQFPALAGAPRVIRESLLFPYVDGAAFVQRLWQNGTRTDPFGEALPLSTEQILRPEADPPLELLLEVQGGALVYEEVLGRLQLGILVEDVLGTDVGVADGWDGDRYALVRSPGGEVGLVSVVVWHTIEARDAFLDAVRGAAGRFEVAVESNALEVGARPASELRLGGLRFTTSVSLTDPR